ncbi:MAG: hypothetical protein RIC19_25265 [Phaeodactylibacter sp.]|uniref:tetratricopeptide repeat protein n=1 Tax=Phaeodactylibacter sp. TaxID=1940289 RepID=UPI0032ED2E5B
MRRTIILAGIFSIFGLFTNTLNAQEEQQASAASLYNDGLEKLKAKDYESALELMGQALEAADSSSETDIKVMQLAKKNGAIAAYYVGSKARKADDFEKAQEVYQQGVEYNPGFYANYIGKAQALEGLEMMAKAVGAYQKAGDVCEKAGKADKAEKMKSKAENMVAVAWGDKDWALVKDMAEAYLEGGKSADVHYYLSDALLSDGSSDDALMHVDKAIELTSTDADKYIMQKAEILKAKGDSAGAIEAYKMVKDSKYVERAKYEIGQLGG